MAATMARNTTPPMMPITTGSTMEPSLASLLTFAGSSWEVDELVDSPGVEELMDPLEVEGDPLGVVPSPSCEYDPSDGDVLPASVVEVVPLER